MRYTCGLAQTQSSICRSVPVYVPTALTIVEPRSHWREISSAISCPLVVMIVSILPALLPYIILSITSEVTAVVTRPYKTASTEPNTGQPNRMTTRSIAPVTTPTDRCGRSTLIDIVKKSVPPLDEPRIYKSANAPPHVIPANRAASNGSPP